MSSLFTKFIADILQSKKPIGYPIDFIMETAAKRPRMLLEYTDAERQKMGIPSGAVSSGGKWYDKDPAKDANARYLGKVVDGRFVPASEEPEEPAGGAAGVASNVVTKDGQLVYQVAGKDDKPLYKRGRYVYTRPQGGKEYLLGTTSGDVFEPSKHPVLWPGEEPVEAPDSEATPETFKKIQSKQNSTVSPLHDALADGEPTTIQLVIDDLQLYLDEDGCLASGLEGVGYLYGKDEKGQKAARQLQAVLAPYGITIPTQRERVASDAQADAFKPQNLAKGVRRAVIKLKSAENGVYTHVTVGDKEYRIMPQSVEFKQKLVERYTPMGEAFARQGMSDREAIASAEEVSIAIHAHNSKLQIIAVESEKRKDAFSEVTDRRELAGALVDLIVKAAGTNLTDEQQTAVRDIFEKLADAETPEEFDAVWADPRARQTRGGVNYGNTDYLRPMLQAANLPQSSFPVLCESIEVMRKSCGGAPVLIPTRQTFELVDIIVLRDAVDISSEMLEGPEALSEDILRQLQFVNIQVEFVGVKSGGKSGAGRASASHTRILLTEFDSPTVRRELLSLVGHEAHDELWKCTTEDQYNAVAAQRTSALRPHMDSIISYYGLESKTEGMDDEAKMKFVFATLAVGTLPIYDADGNFVSAGAEASLFREDNVTDLNRLQLRLYSFLGYAADAIYNTRARLQGFGNVTYGATSIRETDGMTRMARSVFAFNRAAGLWTHPVTKVKVVRPSYSFTASLEYTDDKEDLQHFARRNRPKNVSELLLEYTDAERQKMGIPSGAKSRGGRWYQGNTYVGKVVDGRFVPASQKPEEPAGDAADTPPQKQRVSPTDRSAVDRDAAKMSLASKVKNFRATGEGSKENKEILQQLDSAIQSGDRAKLQEVITKYNLYISPEGKIKWKGDIKSKFRTVGGTGDAAKKFAIELVALCDDLGVEIPKDSENASGGKFKPQAIFGEPEDTIDTMPIENGVEVEGVPLVRKTDADIAAETNRLIAQVNAHRASQTPKKPPLDPKNKKDKKVLDRINQYAKQRADEHNHNIEYLLEVHEAGAAAAGGRGRGGKLRNRAYQFPKKGESQEDGLRRMRETMTQTILAEFVSDEAKRREAVAALEEMTTPPMTAKRFNAAYIKFVKATRGTAVHRNMKYVAESLQAMRVVAFGGTALIPASSAFPVADVISLRLNPMTDETMVTLYLVDGITPDDFEFTVAGSVKYNEGAASANTGKLRATKFRTTKIKQDLLRANSDEMKNKIFTTDGKLSPEARKEIYEFLEVHKKDILKYYGLDDDMSTEDLYHFLSFGRELVCVKTPPPPRPEPTKVGRDESGDPAAWPFTQGQSVNGEQWRAHSVLGKAIEAVHNRNVEQQFYHTAQYTDAGIVVADGIRTVAKMKIQHYKGADPLTPAGGTKPQSAQVARTIPVSDGEELRSGNPCRGQQ